MSVLITLCARGGSKGIPGKNIRNLNGKPLLAYSIETAKKFGLRHEATTALSTDDETIRKVAAEYGLLSDYLRPAQFATDAAGKIDTIGDLLKFEEGKYGSRFDYILDLDLTSPLRTIADLEEAFNKLQTDKNALNIFSVSVSDRNPYFNMVEKQENGYYGLVKKGNFLSRQAAPKVYALNASFYFYRRQFFTQSEKSAITDRSLVYVMPHICFDLDESIDFEFMSFLLSSRNLGFEL